MAEARETRPAPPPSAATVKRKLNQGFTVPLGSPSTESPAALYRARWDTPMPVSTAEERRAPAPAPSAPPSPVMPETPASMYQARWGVPQPVSTGEERREPALGRVLQGLTADDMRRPPADVREGEGRRGGMNPSKAGYGDERRRGAVRPGKESADDRRQPPADVREGRGRRGAPAPTAGHYQEESDPGSGGSADDRRARVAQTPDTTADEAAAAVMNMLGFGGTPYSPREMADDRRTQAPAAPVERNPSQAADAVATLLGFSGVDPAAVAEFANKPRRKYDPQAVDNIRALLAAAKDKEDGGYSIRQSPGDMDLIPGDLVGDWIQGSNWGRGDDGYSLNLPIDVDREGLMGVDIGFGFHGDEPGGVAPRSPDAAPGVDELEVMLDDALRQQRRAALGLNRQRRVPVRNIAMETSDTMSPTQRQSVAWNRALVQAVNKDRRRQKGDDAYTPTATEKALYDDTLVDLFGDKRGSGLMYAPETLGMLTKLGVQDDAASLNDFLRLKTAVTNEELANQDTEISGFVGPTVARNAKGRASDVAQDRQKVMREYGAKQEALNERLAAGNQLLQSMNATQREDRNSATEQLGGTPNEVRRGPGWGAPTDAEGRQTMDGWFQSSYNALASGDDKAWASMKAEAAKHSPADWAKFLAYLDTRSAQAERYGEPLGNVEGTEFLTPEEFRARLKKLGGLRG